MSLSGSLPSSICIQTAIENDALLAMLVHRADFARAHLGQSAIAGPDSAATARRMTSAFQNSVMFYNSGQYRNSDRHAGLQFRCLFVGQWRNTVSLPLRVTIQIMVNWSFQNITTNTLGFFQCRPGQYSLAPGRFFNVHE
jgi:hypothetical protein